MGKKRINQLLEQLQANQEKELHNAAAIFTVAQVAVNELREQIPESAETAIADLPAAPASFTKAELLQRYGSYNHCRKAAQQQGIKFSRTPTWQQLEAGFSYAETCRQLVRSYMDAHPNPDLEGVAIAITLG